MAYRALAWYQMPVADVAKATGFIRHLHAFRGFAILNVVAAHAWSSQVLLFGGAELAPGVPALSAVSEILFHDSTIYFALISGILFSIVLQSRGWSKFFIGKLHNVVSPYILMTALFTPFFFGRDQQFAGFDTPIEDFLYTFGENLWTGGALYPYWYIPILIVLFVATPLLAWLLARPNAHWVIGLIVVMPLLVSRTAEVSWSNPVYFLGAYTAGMYVGSNYDRFLDAFRRHLTLLSIIAVTSTLVLVASFLFDVDELGIVSLRESFWYLQKLALSAIVLVWLCANARRLPRWLDTVATTAFSIYFLHAFVLLLLEKIQAYAGLASSRVTAIIFAGLLCLIATVWICVLLSQFTRQVLGKRSRLLIGA